MVQTKNSITNKGKILLISLLILVVVIAAIAAFFIFRHPKATDLPPIVSIDTPASGNLAEINVSLGIQAQAEDFPGVKRVELYADGALVAVQESDLANGGNPLILNQSWTPLTLGRHALVARGYDSSGKFGDSTVVYVDVVELISPSMTINVDELQHGDSIPSPSLGQIADAGGVSVDDLLGVNPSLSGTDPNAPLPPGTVVTVPRTPAPAPSETGGTPPVPLAGTPAAPTNLTGTIDCSTAQISWTASPEADNGYAVYRISPADMSPVRVATVGRGTANYSEPVSGSGAYRYQVAALRNGMEGMSGYFLLSTPDSCASVSTSPDVISLVLNVSSLTTTEPYDGVYCYFSFDQSAHQRVPDTDFTSLAPDSSGTNFNLQAQLPNRGLFVLSTHAATQPVTIDGECRGIRGVESLELGSLAISLPPSDWDGSERHATARQSAQVASTSVTPMASDTFILNFRVGYERADTLRTFTPPYFGNIPPEELRPVALLDPGFPAPYDLSADFGSSPVRCTPSSERVVCRAATGLHLSWKYNGDRNLIGGFGYLIYRDYYQITTADANGVSISDNRDVYFIENILAQYCGTSDSLPFTIYVLDKTNRKVNFAMGILPNPPCDTQVANVEVTLDNLAIGPSSAHHTILDNDTCILCDDNRMELIGYVGLTGSSGGSSSTVLWQGYASRDTNPLAFLTEIPVWQARGLVGDVCGLQAAACVYGPSGTTSYQWADLQLQAAAGYGQNNNVLTIKIMDGHTATLAFELYDIPTGVKQETDPFCIATIAFPWRNAQEWQNVNEQRTIDQDQGEASCHITYTVRGSIP